MICPLEGGAVEAFGGVSFVHRHGGVSFGVMAARRDRIRGRTAAGRMN